MNCIKRLPVIRHIRWLWLSWCLDRHLSNCSQMGIGFVPQDSDIAYLEAVWRGEL